MDALDAATSRLMAALEIIEQHGEAMAQAKDEAKTCSDELARLNRERETLLARIAELEEETRSLAGITEEVETRLDGAIAEIRATLGQASTGQA
ncbi:MAG TPA: DUF4164 family protein [Rhizomicrobium sp.]